METKDLLTEANEQYAKAMNSFLRPKMQKQLQEMLSKDIARYIDSRDRRIEEVLSKTASFQDEDVCEIAELKYGKDFKLYDAKTVMGLMRMMYESGLNVKL